jgi:carboxylate-amine ligase
VLSSADIQRAFDEADSLTIGAEEELMLCDPETLDLAPRADAVFDLVAGDPRFKRELPASQFEIVTAVHRAVPDLTAELAGSRRDLAALARDAVVLAAAGVHPFAAAEGELNDSERYRATAAEYPRFARRQLVFALQIHVAPGSAARALGVYNALRSYLPEIAALAANAPLYQGEDTGLASIRPKLSELLPRQGVPPALESWDEYAEALAWGARSGAVPEPGNWWWELRPHPRFGTLEVRVPDTQITVADAAAVAAFVHCLVGWLGDRHDAGEPLVPAPAWRIAANRWWALRDGGKAELADLDTGERRPLRQRMGELIEALRPYGERLGCASELADVARLAELNGAARQRRVAAQRGPEGLVRWLADSF